MECIQGPGLAQNWKNEMRHTQIDPYNWEAIKAHFLWTCHSIPQQKKMTKITLILTGEMTSTKAWSLAPCSQGRPISLMLPSPTLK